VNSYVRYKRVETPEELQQILELQRLNIPESLSDFEREKQGFVTVHHNLEILNAMNDKCPHVIATYNDKVIGYTLCMIKKFRDSIEVLQPMFQQIEKLANLDQSFIVMGQVCVAKKFRRKGVFRGLYIHMKNELKSKFNNIITEVDKQNTRSLNAHYAIGFKVLYSYRSNNQDWEILGWNINNN